MLRNHILNTSLTLNAVCIGLVGLYSAGYIGIPVVSGVAQVESQQTDFQSDDWLNTANAKPRVTAKPVKLSRR